MKVKKEEYKLEDCKLLAKPKVECLLKLYVYSLNSLATYNFNKLIFALSGHFS